MYFFKTYFLKLSIQLAGFQNCFRGYFYACPTLWIVFPFSFSALLLIPSLPLGELCVSLLNGALWVYCCEGQGLHSGISNWVSVPWTGHLSVTLENISWSLKFCLLSEIFFKSTCFSQTYSAFEQSSQQELSGMFLRLDHLCLTREHVFCYRLKSQIFPRVTCLENRLLTYFNHFSHCRFYS